MQVAVDISLYPLDQEFIPPIKDPMSTQIRGEYGEVMTALTKEIGTTFERVPKAVFAIRILNNPIAG